MQLPNTFSEIDNLELLAKQLVEGFIIGLHKSPYHGFSVEFAEHRQYNHGDNLKHVDWKVYGRKDTMFTKKYEEETNLRCCIAIDTSGSMYFPEERMNKLQHSCIGAAALIHLLKKQLDAFAIAQLDEQLSYLSKFGTTSSHYKQQIAHLQHLATSSHRLQKTNISQSLHELAERIHQRSLVVLFTDIPYQEIADQRFLDGILHLKHRKNEVLIFHLIDKRVEEQFELENTPHELVDLETGQSIKVHPNSIKTSYIAKIKSYKEHIQQFCLMHNIGLLSFGLEQSITIILQEYLQKRSKMM
jgi:uncharacterized protein (DUF58 family)